MSILEDLESYSKKDLKGFRKLLFLVDNTLVNTGFQATSLYRISNFLYRKKVPFLHRFFNYIQRIITGSDINYTAQISEGIKIIHGFGVVIGGEVKLGKNAYLMNDITIGSKIPGGGQPVIGDNVYIGVGSRILGEITIGNNVIIGANSIVLEDVPDNCTVAGSPAKIVKVR